MMTTQHQQNSQNKTQETEALKRAKAEGTALANQISQLKMQIEMKDTLVKETMAQDQTEAKEKDKIIASLK